MLPRWICSQIGAREHYAIPRALRRLGWLERCFTDVWSGRLGTALPRRLAGLPGVGAYRTRSHAELADVPVESFPLRLRLGRLGRRDPKERGARLEQRRREGGAFADLVRHRLDRVALDSAAHRYFGYTNGCLETLVALRERGIPRVVDQIDPGRVEEAIVLEERRRWPGWEPAGTPIPDAYFDRVAAEWAAADVVLVNSAWSATAVERQGVPAEKLFLCPLSFEPACAVEGPDVVGRQRRRTRGELGGPGPLRVLFLGQVTLRKGMAYLVEAARLLEAARVPVVFHVVGPIGIAPEVVHRFPGNVSVHGPVPRDAAAAWYRRADVFVLPTLSDGFALTQLEAMAYGLPVVATDRCGDVVEPGRNGFRVAAGDAVALAEVLTRLADDRSCLPALADGALATSRRFGLGTLAANLRRLEQRLAGRSAARAA